MSDALAECDERGWDVLPLAAKKMTRMDYEESCRALARKEPPKGI